MKALLRHWRDDATPKEGKPSSDQPSDLARLDVTQTFEALAAPNKQLRVELIKHRSAEGQVGFELMSNDSVSGRVCYAMGGSWREINTFFSTPFSVSMFVHVCPHFVFMVLHYLSLPAKKRVPVNHLQPAVPTQDKLRGRENQRPQRACLDRRDVFGA